MKCLYCGSIENLEVEHLIPRARGGLDVEGNIFRACSSCNVSKNDRLPSEWRTDLPAEVYELERAALNLHAAVSPRKSRTVKNTKVLKEDHINVRCTEEQKEMIDRAAKRDGLGSSSWMLQIALRAAREAESRP